MRRLLVDVVVIVAFVFSLSTPAVLAQDVCEGNFDCDQDVDGTDAAVFKLDFGRSPFFEPCDTCIDSPCPCTSPGCDPPAAVPKTGQTTSYATGDDGDLEKGVLWANPRFTDNVDGTVTDNMTGLIWLKNANCFGLRSWNNALSDSDGLSSGTCGLTDDSNAGDWRLPNRRELFSLIHDDYYNPALPDTVGSGQWSQDDPFTNVQSSFYWSSTNSSEVPTDRAWYVNMYYGVMSSNSKSSSYYVWPVRGGH